MKTLLLVAFATSAVNLRGASELTCDMTDYRATQLEVNLGYVWYRKDSDNTVAIGVRHADREEGYNPAWINGVFALYNAPPGTWQRMSVYFYLSPSDAQAGREWGMAYTHGDRYPPPPGYQTMGTPFQRPF